MKNIYLTMLEISSPQTFKYDKVIDEKLLQNVTRLKFGLSAVLTIKRSL